MLRLYALYRLKRFRFLTEIWRLLDNDVLIFISFKWKPIYKTLWHWHNVRVKAEGFILIHEALMKAIGKALKTCGIEMGLLLACDASPTRAMPRDTEGRYDGYYMKLCYLVHKLVCRVRNLTLTWAVTPGKG